MSIIPYLHDTCQVERGLIPVGTRPRVDGRRQWRLGELGTSLRDRTLLDQREGGDRAPRTAAQQVLDVHFIITSSLVPTTDLAVVLICDRYLTRLVY
jgi:hypothetical protein